jgi:dienelactone hydrolase
MRLQSMRVRGSLFLRILLIVVASLLVIGNLTLAQTDREALDLAQELLQQLVDGDYESVVANFDETMQAALPQEALQENWETVVSQVGPYQQELGHVVEESQGYQVVTLVLEFEAMTLDLVVSYNADSTVAGLYIRPSTTPIDSETPESADYVNPDAFTEVDVVVGEMSDWALPGTLALPVGEGPFPAVVLVQGSGPSDRDETVGPNKPFRDIAQGLASNGIAVLRYDKRTWVYAEQIADNLAGFTVQEEFVDDALQAVALLLETGGIDPGNIYVLGHSEGGLVAPRIATQDPDIAGIIIAAGNTRPLIDLLVEQTHYLINLDGEVSDQEAAALADVEAGVETIQALTAESDPTEVVLGAAPAYWLDLRDYDPVATAQDYAGPMLILQGERDYQVTLDDLAGWQAGLSDRDNVTFITYPALNHLFMAGEGEPNNVEYFTPGFVDAQVITDVAGWILDNSAG